VEDQVVRAFDSYPAHLTFGIIDNVLEPQIGFALNLFLTQEPCKETNTRRRTV